MSIYPSGQRDRLEICWVMPARVGPKTLSSVFYISFFNLYLMCFWKIILYIIYNSIFIKHFFSIVIVMKRALIIILTFIEIER